MHSDQISLHPDIDFLVLSSPILLDRVGQVSHVFSTIH